MESPTTKIVMTKWQVLLNTTKMETVHLAICLNENNEEILTEGQAQTNIITVKLPSP